MNKHFREAAIITVAYFIISGAAVFAFPESLLSIMTLSDVVVSFAAFFLVAFPVYKKIRSTSIVPPSGAALSFALFCNLAGSLYWWLHYMVRGLDTPMNFDISNIGYMGSLFVLAAFLACEYYGKILVMSRRERKEQEIRLDNSKKSGKSGMFPEIFTCCMFVVAIIFCLTGIPDPVAAAMFIIPVLLTIYFTLCIMTVPVYRKPYIPLCIVTLVIGLVNFCWSIPEFSDNSVLYYILESVNICAYLMFVPAYYEISEFYEIRSHGAGSYKSGFHNNSMETLRKNDACTGAENK